MDARRFVVYWWSLLFLCIFIDFVDGSNVFDTTLSHSCFQHQGHTLCYDGYSSSNTVYSISNAAELEKRHVSDHASLDNEEISKSRTSCRIAAQSKYRLHVSNNSFVPVILFQPRYCVGFGNQLGFAYELISFALHQGIAILRVDRHDHFPVHQCSEERDARPMLRSLPKVVLPAHVGQELSLSMCDTIPEWPWESPNPYFFKKMSFLTSITSYMVSQYQLKALNHLRRDVRVFTNALAIHFRCSDNLAHPAMGLLPYSEYNRTLTLISTDSHFRLGTGQSFDHSAIRSVVIYTDTHLYRSHGAICTRALAEVEALISAHPRLKSMDLIVHRTTTMKTFALMHLSRYLLCSASTLCFFASVGHDHAYIPVGTGIVMKLPSYSFESNFTFIQTRMIRPRQETMHPDEFAKDFLAT